MVLSDGKTINAENLDIEASATTQAFPTLRQAREKAETDIIMRALASTQNNVSQASKLLGVSRPTLYELMKSLGIKA